MSGVNSTILFPILQEGSKILNGIQKNLNKNIKSCFYLKKYISSSFGPRGLYKLIKQKTGKILVTSDGSTILDNLEYIHPIPKLISLCAIVQEQELGDSVSFVILFTIELLCKSHELIKQGFCLSIIIDNFLEAENISLYILESLAEYKISNIFQIKTIASLFSLFIDFKYFNLECYLAPQIAYACVKLFSIGIKTFSSENIRVIKILGGNFDQIKTIAGTLLIQDTEGSIKLTRWAKIVIFGCSFSNFLTETKCTLTFKTAKEVLFYTRNESYNIEKKVQNISKNGINVIISNEFDEASVFYMNKYNIMAIRIQSKFDIKRIAKTCGASILSKYKFPDQNEIGTCDSVSVKSFGLQKIIVFQKEILYSKIFTIIIRSNSSIILDNIEKIIYKITLIFKSLTRDGRFVPGAGICETELCKKLMNFSCRGYNGYKQHIIQKFSECFEIIPMTLITNDKKSIKEKRNFLNYFYVKNNTTCAIKKKEIWDLFTSKYWAIKHSVEISTTVLTIGQIIMARQFKK